LPSFFHFQTLQFRLAFVNISHCPTPLIAVIFFGYCGISHKQLISTLDISNNLENLGNLHDSDAHQTSYMVAYDAITFFGVISSELLHHKNYAVIQFRVTFGLIHHENYAVF
jgi:hypothetical protein